MFKGSWRSGSSGKKAVTEVQTLNSHIVYRELVCFLTIYRLEHCQPYSVGSALFLGVNFDLTSFHKTVSSQFWVTDLPSTQGSSQDASTTLLSLWSEACLLVCLRSQGESEDSEHFVSLKGDYKVHQMSLWNWCGWNEFIAPKDKQIYVWRWKIVRRYILLAQEALDEW